MCYRYWNMRRKSGHHITRIKEIALNQFKNNFCCTRFELPSYRHRLLLLQMNTLYDRRTKAQICFVFQLINGAIKSPQLYNKIGFRIYQRSFRNQELLLINLNDNDPYNIMRQKFNEFSNTIDFNRSLMILKNILKYYFKMQL